MSHGGQSSEAESVVHDAGVDWRSSELAVNWIGAWCGIDASVRYCAN